MSVDPKRQAEFEYVVVGSKGGGGTSRCGSRRLAGCPAAGKPSST